ncbi:hypothetical protein [Maricaulis salignorans]|uniref:hypothetical protein n=1 Tax=Maricaulis salignorans TaxID=144026 RepID=UPI003A94F84A
MDRFSFVMVLLSIIVGLGVTELLTNVARQIRNRARSRFYWLHSVMVALVFIALLQQWWEAWDQRLVETWSFPILLLMLGGPIGLYIISHLLFPDDAEGVDYDRHYFANTRQTYLLGAATVVFATIYRPLSFGHGLVDMDNLSSAFILAAFLALAIWKTRMLHQILVPLLFAALVLDVLVFHFAL